ncbi:DUF3877 family protein [Clostridium transplantifaecale]|uniref:DUF3877 family protein n=1 Tax=Clostridium transplantifaecale TaxID=2479838 RepID=UPI000F641319|nr:DUF3877 family protein [Clostridium transplantifaecale]
MTTEFLRQHIFDTIKEWQMKIGSREESIRLYYPAASLIKLLRFEDVAGDKKPEGEAGLGELDGALLIFAQDAEPLLGKIRFSRQGERYCIEVPEKGCAYIADAVSEPEFLKRFLSVITAKDSTLEQIRACFRDFAGMHELGYTEEDREGEGVGHVFYFSSGVPEPYIYCVEEDEFGLTYHRFTREDYEDLSGEDTH